MSRVPYKSERPPHGSPTWAPYDFASYRGGNGVGAVAITYATFNPADSGYNAVSFSNGNLTLTGGGWELVRSTLSKEADEWVVEFTANSVSTAIVGVCTADATLANFLGFDAYGFGYYSANGNVLRSAGAVAALSVWTTGDKIGVKFTPGATVQFYKNGAAEGAAIDISALVGPVFIGASCFGGGDIITANFGATAMTYDYGSDNVGLFA